MRLFLALVPPPDVLRELTALTTRLVAEHAGWRATRAEGLHLTLRFLGAVDAAREHELRATWGAAAAATTAPLELRLGALGCFPDARRARVLWIGIEEARGGSALGRLAERIEAASRLHGFAAETRAFHSHVTLARAARDARPDPVAEAPRPAADASRATFEIPEVTLFESRLGPGGARYTALARFPFRSPETPS